MIIKRRRIISAILLTLAISLCLAPAFADEAGYTYDYVYNSYSGLRLVLIETDSSDVVYSFLDEEGKHVTASYYSHAEDFAFGDETLVEEDGTYKLIGTKGDSIVEFGQYDSVLLYNGLGAMARDRSGKYAVINRDGIPVTEFKYNQAYHFPINKNLFLVSESDSGEHSRAVVWGLASVDGMVQTEQIYYNFIQIAGETGMSALPCHKLDASGEAIYGFIDAQGNEKDFIYKMVGGFHEGIAGVSLDNQFWALADSAGNRFTDYRFESCPDFREGLAVVNGENGAYFIDRAGSVVEFSDSYEFITRGSTNGWIEATSYGVNVMIESPIKAGRTYHIYVNDQWVYTDQEPIIQEGRMLVPIRSVAEALGYDVDWNTKTQEAVLQNRKTIVGLKVDGAQAYVNTFDDGVPAETIDLDVGAQLINGRVFVPLRFAGEAFGAEVEWKDNVAYISV